MIQNFNQSTLDPYAAFAEDNDILDSQDAKVPGPGLYHNPPKVNPFESLFVLVHEIAVYVPTTINGDTPANTQYWTKEIVREFSTLFGGCTITEGFGCWNSEEKGLIQEAVKIVTSSCLDLSHIERVYDLAKELKLALSQEAVSVKIDGKLYLI